jgi:hypothetical protein
MPKFLTDENVDRRIVEAIILGLSHLGLDILTARQAGLVGTPDPRILEWAAEHDRIVLTHDYRSMIGFAYERVSVGLPMPGVVAVPKSMHIGTAVRELEVLLGAGLPEDLANQVLFISG